MCACTHTKDAHTVFMALLFFIFILYVCLCTMCFECPRRSERILILFELELGRIVSHFVCACKLLIHSQRQSSHNHFPKFLPLIIAKWGLSFNKNFGGCTFKVEHSLQKTASVLFLGGPFFSKVKGGGMDLGEGAWKEGREGKLWSGCIENKKYCLFKEKEKQSQRGR